MGTDLTGFCDGKGGGWMPTQATLLRYGRARARERESESDLIYLTGIGVGIQCHVHAAQYCEELCGQRQAGRHMLPYE
jgi:hypothetical protein